MEKSYSGNAPLVHLAGTIGATDMSFTCSEIGTGYPDGTDGPFVVRMNRNPLSGSEEAVLCSARTLSTFTVAPGGRGYDGTAAAIHNPGETIEHGYDAVSAREASAHVNDATLDQHGQYLNNARHDIVTRHVLGTALPPAVGGELSHSAPGDTEALGSTGHVPDAGHKHPREAAATAGQISHSAPGDVEALGTTGRAVDAGHKHPREDPSTVVFPTGMGAPFFGSVAPAGWALTVGSEVGRTDPVYAALFAVIGTTYGVGNGTTTFNLPDSRGRTLVGAGAGAGLTARALGATGGEETHLLITAEIPAHPHPVTDPTHFHGVTDPGHGHSIDDGGVDDNRIVITKSGAQANSLGGPASPGNTFSHLNHSATGVLVNNSSTGISGTGNAGGGGAHNVMQPWLAANGIIKL